MSLNSTNQLRSIVAGSGSTGTTQTLSSLGAEARLEQIAGQTGPFTINPGVTLFRTMEGGDTITTSITVNLAAANTYQPGQRVVIADSAQLIDSVSGGSLSILAAGSDTIYVTGGSPITLNQTNGYIELSSDGVSNWSFVSSSISTINDTMGVPVKLGSPNAVTITLSGNLVLPRSTSTVGQIFQNGLPLIHTFRNPSGTADRNLFIGAGGFTAGNLTLTGSTGSVSGGNNIGIGAEAQVGLTTGYRNVSVGDAAGRVMTIANNNCHFGFNAGLSQVSGSGLVAIGAFALQTTTLGVAVGVGYESLSVFTGQRGTAIGYQAGKTLGNANYCVFVGDAADTTAATTNNQTAIGSGATTGASYATSLGSDVANTIANSVKLGRNLETVYTPGGRNKHVKAVVDTYTLDTTTPDEVIICDKGTGFTLTLSNSTTAINSGRSIIIKNKGAGTVTIASSTGSQIFDTSAVASISLVTGASATLICDGVVWNKI